MILIYCCCFNHVAVKTVQFFVISITNIKETVLMQHNLQDYQVVNLMQMTERLTVVFLCFVWQGLN